ncbi:MAG: low molecular weight phosphotyrosine protein phosphatase, partial [Saprospiraceae bacterium]|nr:low molecular weight phosphotyrosine protein phosphatase [Saprospiraceae bacterium]
PDQRSIATARQHGIDITGQRARQFEAADLERFDRIFVMDTQNLRDVLRHADDGERREKVSLILDHLFPGQQRSVPDPYYDDDGFEEVFRMLDDACESFIRDHLEAST